MRRSPSATPASHATLGHSTSGYPSTSRARLRSRDPSPPVRMKSRPDELRGVETSLGKRNGACCDVVFKERLHDYASQWNLASILSLGMLRVELISD